MRIETPIPQKIRDNKGRFVKNHSTMPHWGFQEGNKVAFLRTGESYEKAGIKISKALTGKKLSEEHKQKLKQNHVGNTGKKFSQEHKDNIGKGNKGKTASYETRMKQSQARVRLLKESPHQVCLAKRGYKQGWYKIVGRKKLFLRSLWEVNYATYLQFLLNKKYIIKWEYEVDTFWFEKIKRGVRSYTPDFKITNLDKSIEYHEVKGWMDAKSATKIKRMAIYYPEVKLIVIQKAEYKEVEKFSRLYPSWVKLDQIHG